jgi:hypothetical protein
VQRAQGDAVRDVIRPAGLVPAHVGGVEADGLAIQLGVEAAQRAGIAVGREDVAAEGGIALASAPASTQDFVGGGLGGIVEGVRVEAGGGQDLVVKRGGEVLVQDDACGGAGERGVAREERLDVRRERARRIDLAQRRHGGVGVGGAARERAATGDGPKAVGLEAPEGVLGALVATLGGAAEVGEQLAQRLFDGTVGQAGDSALPAGEREQQQQRFVRGALSALAVLTDRTQAPQEVGGSHPAQARKRPDAASRCSGAGRR